MALDAFLQFKDKGAAGADIIGETQDKAMMTLSPRPFDLTNWTFGVSQDVNVGSGAGGIGAGKVNFEQFKVTKNIDNSSPLFFLTLCNGGHYGDVSLMVRKAGTGPKESGGIYLQFDFKLVFVSNISWSHSDPAPTEDITFDYGALQIIYKPQNKDGTLGGEKKSSWSRVLNTEDFEVV